MTAQEVNLDGIVGPTHNYAGLSFGNVASEKHARSVSNPREAALQGLRKMKFVHGLGIGQLILPPQPRPHMRMLHSVGLQGLADAPAPLLHAAYSASAMWTANAATVSPSADTADNKLHFTPANLASNLHRSLEPETTSGYLKHIFSGDAFIHHAPLPAQASFADEGAANHMRLARGHGEPGLEIFVYGGAARRFPARQTRQSVEAVARMHRLAPARTVLLEQSPEAIDAGVFHNDVIAMSNEHLLVYHEKAYTGWDERLDAFTCIRIAEAELPLADAVGSYFFNSQLLSLPGGGMAVIAPQECESHPKARACFDRLVAQGHVAELHYLDVRESMKNGGGPACLRLRVSLTDAEKSQTHQGVWFNDALFDSLCRWIQQSYRDRISPEDLRDPLLADEAEKALAGILSLLSLS